MKELVQNKDIYRTATFLKHVLLLSSNFFRTDTFSTKVLFQKRDFFTWRYDAWYYYCIIISLIFNLDVFQNSYFLEKANFWKMHNSALPNLPGEPVFESGKDLTFHSRYFFRRRTILQLRFFSTAHFLLIKCTVS